MSKSFNIFCDESCHLENDGKPVMVLGAVWCPTDRVAAISSRLSEIKIKHKLTAKTELKWTKVSPFKTAMFLELLDYFFDEHDLHFRALVAAKKGLRHADYSQNHNDWYYKMYFSMVKAVLSPEDEYMVYMDIKDTRGRKKIKHLHQLLCADMDDFSREIIKRIQVIRSHESHIMQLADLLIGAISYVHRNLAGNSAKVAMVDRIRTRTSYSLRKPTLPLEDKMNLSLWNPTEASP
ncbi:MAG TPA: DUF3800 domain-containing protein [Pirellulaceae bacterium]|jgi:hypothetical protein